MGREGGRKENALVFKREGREGSWEAAAVSLGIPHNLFYFGGKQAPGSAVSVYSALTKEDIDQERH